MAKDKGERMTENQTKVVELSKKFEQLKKELETARMELDTVLGQMEYNSYFQDEATMIVYKIVRPKGTFVSFREVDYHRTAQEGERQGSLSKKEAEQAGYSA